jgi:hypothetical protein
MIYFKKGDLIKEPRFDDNEIYYIEEVYQEPYLDVNLNTLIINSLIYSNPGDFILITDILREDDL